MIVCSNCKVKKSKITHGVVIYCNGNPIFLPEGYVLECNNNKHYVARRLISNGGQVEAILRDDSLSEYQKRKLIAQKTVIDPQFTVKIEDMAIEVEYDKEFVGTPYQALQAGWYKGAKNTWLCPDCVVSSGHGNETNHLTPT